MGNAVPSPELAKLRELYASTVSAKAVFDDFASRTNNQRITKVDQVQNRLRNEGVHRWEIIALFRQLEGLGYGKFIEGRKGHPSRFVWSSSPIDVGKGAQGAESPITPVTAAIFADENVAEMRDYVFPLRSDADAKIQLPTDLTQKEAERLCAFLKTLAIPD